MMVGRTMKSVSPKMRTLDEFVETHPNEHPEDILDLLEEIGGEFPGIDREDVLGQAISNAETSRTTLKEALEKLPTLLSSEKNISQLYYEDVGKTYEGVVGSADSIPFLPENREKILSLNTKLVISIAKRYRGLGIEMSDLIGAGNLGLCVAWDKFDPSRQNLRETLLKVVKNFPPNIPKQTLEKELGSLIGYGKIQNKFMSWVDEHESEIQRESLMEWIGKNVKNAKFSSVAAMWIRAYILIELDSKSRLVKKPRTLIYSEKEKTGSYQVESNLSLDESPPGEDRDNQLRWGDTLRDTSPLPGHSQELIESTDEYRDALLIMLRGVHPRDRAVLLKKFGIGLPRPMTSKEISKQEGISGARISQICQQVLDKMRKNAEAFGLDFSKLFEIASNMK